METPRAETFRKLLEKEPDNPMILCSLGIELFKEGRYPEAMEHLRRAIKNKPDYSVAYRMLGRAHFELHENAEARRVFALCVDSAGAALTLPASMRASNRNGFGHRGRAAHSFQ